MKTEKSPAFWLTTLQPSKEKSFLKLIKTYNPEDYPEYDNFSAVEVNRTQNIPKDYIGIMGVPTTFIEKYNPKQFEIIGITTRIENTHRKKYYLAEKYKNANDLNGAGVLMKDGNPKAVYTRILIKHKGGEE